MDEIYQEHLFKHRSNITLTRQHEHNDSQCIQI